MITHLLNPRSKFISLTALVFCAVMAPATTLYVTRYPSISREPVAQNYVDLAAYSFGSGIGDRQPTPSVLGATVQEMTKPSASAQVPPSAAQGARCEQAVADRSAVIYGQYANDMANIYQRSVADVRNNFAARKRIGAVPQTQLNQEEYAQLASMTVSHNSAVSGKYFATLDSIARTGCASHVAAYVYIPTPSYPTLMSVSESSTPAMTPRPTTVCSDETRSAIEANYQRALLDAEDWRRSNMNAIGAKGAGDSSVADTINRQYGGKLNQAKYQKTAQLTTSGCL